MRYSSREIGRLRQRNALLIFGAGVGAWIGIDWVAASEAIAQISGDNSLGTQVNGSLTDSCAITLCTITGGTPNVAGSTLFHSFDQFTSSEGLPNQSALFVDPGVSDIIVRVTGGNQSFLNGLIQASEGSIANLFFVNPSGITFGESARLDLGGSFLASTANEIVFENGSRLLSGEATTPNSELLTVSTPIGLGFLANAAPIKVQGTGNRLTFGAPDAPNSQFVNRLFQQPLPPTAPFPPLPPLSALSVRPGQTLSLVANGVELSGGNLFAQSGQIEIGSVAEGTVAINPDASLNYAQVSQFSDILLANRSTLEASAPNPGSILLRGADITIQDGSAVLAELLPDNSASPVLAPPTKGVIDIEASGTALVTGFTSEPAIPLNPPFFSYLSVDAAPGTVGAGGQIDLRAQSLIVSNGGQIGAIAYGSGSGGEVNVVVEEAVELTGGSPFGPSGLFATADSIGSGDSGKIRLQAGMLQASQGAQIATDSATQGSAGKIQISANLLSLSGTSEPIEVLTPSGMIESVVPTAIRSEMGATATGEGEDIEINVNQLSIGAGAEILTVTAGAGNAGNINIDASEVVVSGRTALGEEGPSTISTVVAPGAVGSGGALNINTNSLQVLESAQVGTSTAGSGNAGNLSINSQSVLISGQNELGRSGLFANAISLPGAGQSTGAGGNLQVQAETLRVTEGGTLNVSNFPSAAPNRDRPPQQTGSGDAGNLTVNAQQISLDEAGIISADTAEGDRGNITLQTKTLTLRRGSRITANAIGTSTGGNIAIEAPEGFIVAVPEENSDITANAVLGAGGRVDITAQNVIGIEPRAELTSLSDITTSSEAGIAGETQVERLNTELQTEDAPLPQSTEVPQVAQGCSASSTNSSFVQSGRGGLSDDPYGVLNSRDSLADISLPSALARTALSRTDDSAMSSDAEAANPDTISEAQGWVTNAAGSIVLLAEGSSEVERCINWQS